jgi:hypothetical protein
MIRPRISEARKLAQLRALTDRQLTALIDNQLERGFALARHLEYGSAEYYEEMTRLCLEVGRLLPVVNRADRARLQSRLSELQNTMVCGMTMGAAS